MNKNLVLVSVDDYLDAELATPIKHEYVGGAVYRMADNRNAHNIKPCRPFDSATKIRIRLPNQVRFYHPDVSVICRPKPQSDYYQDWPAVIFEVLSRRTRRIDEGEKKDAYLAIPSLSVYVLVEQETHAVVAFRRTPQGFVREVHEGLDAVLPLPEIDIDLPLAEIYNGVEIAPEPAEDDA